MSGRKRAYRGAAGAMAIGGMEFLGTTSERDLVNAPATAALDLSNDPLQRQIEADAAALRGREEAP
ncbi:MAG TPA: hypothetical protein VH253_15885 [Phycisphaerae bacterium]|nr:hypothetical protein [Phycisphaerae bacterium]